MKGKTYQEVEKIAMKMKIITTITIIIIIIIITKELINFAMVIFYTYYFYF